LPSISEPGLQPRFPYQRLVLGTLIRAEKCDPPPRVNSPAPYFARNSPARFFWMAIRRLPCDGDVSHPPFIRAYFRIVHVGILEKPPHNKIRGLHRNRKVLERPPSRWKPTINEVRKATPGGKVVSNATPASGRASPFEPALMRPARCGGGCQRYPVCREPRCAAIVSSNFCVDAIRYAQKSHHSKLVSRAGQVYQERARPWRNRDLLLKKSGRRSVVISRAPALARFSARDPPIRIAVRNAPRKSWA